MYKQGCFSKTGFWSVFPGGMVLGFLFCLALSLTALVITGCAEDAGCF